MEENTIDPEKFIKDIKEGYGENIFYEAVHELTENEIVFEGQFPFLDDGTMRDRNLKAQKEIFKRYGYQEAENITNLSFEVADQGWMHCFFVFGGRFNEIEEVRKAVISYFSNR